MSEGGVGLLEGGGEEFKELVEECVEERGKGERWRIIETIKEKLLQVSDTGLLTILTKKNKKISIEQEIKRTTIINKQ